MQSHGYGLTDMKRTSTIRRGLKRMRDNVEDYNQLTKRQRSDSMTTHYGTDPDAMEEDELLKQHNIYL
jgi:stage III sporulation protein SpoIIIAA